MKYKKFFVTGAKGFIGSTLCSFLEDSDQDVVKVDFYSDGSKFELTPQDMITRFLREEPDDKSGILIHVGADSNASAKNLSEISHKNIELTKDLFYAANTSGIPGIFISSSAVYGNNRLEATDSTVGNPYAVSKKMGEKIVHDITRQTGTSNIVLRLFNAYGPREFHKKEMMSIPTKFAIDSIKKRNIEIWNIEGELTQSRDFIYSEDVAKLIYAVSQKITFSNQTYDLGSGKPVSFKEIAEKIVESFPASIKLVDPPIALDKESYQTFTKAENGWISENEIDIQFKSFEQNFEAYKKYIKNWTEIN
jgi:ADP-L-glycero-D-manno-heptose 6-epimerase